MTAGKRYRSAQGENEDEDTLYTGEIAEENKKAVGSFYCRFKMTFFTDRVYNQPAVRSQGLLSQSFGDVDDII